MGHPLAADGGDQVECRAPEWLTRAETHHLPDQLPIDSDFRPAKADGELIDPA
jgi:hypothetical protein